jgi:hypothetical protein
MAYQTFSVKRKQQLLKSTIFRLRTALGESDQTYKHIDETPIHGTGQGSCSSPEIWLMISILFMNLLRRHSFEIRMDDAEIYKESIYQIIEGVVDDTSIITNDEGNNGNSLQEKLESDSTWWAGLLESSCGKLELAKCFYYLL